MTSAVSPGAPFLVAVAPPAPARRPSAATSPALALVLSGLALASTSGCPQGTRHDTLHLPLLTSDDPEADAEMQAAREAFEQGDAAGAKERYRRFLLERPRDPLAPIARLGLGQILLAEGRSEEARAHFEAVAQHEDPSVAERGRFYGGVALHLLGRHDAALEALRPFVGRTVDPLETSLLLRTIAAASEQKGDRIGALEALDALVAASVPDEHRREARERIEGVAAGATDEEVTRAAELLPRAGAAWPAVARRALAAAYRANDLARVQGLAASLREAGVELDEELAAYALRAERASEADTRVVGAILPLSGRGREVGQHALEGLMLAAGLPPRGPPSADAVQVVFRDDAGDPERAAAAVEDLVALHRVIAIIGPLTGPSAARAAARARELGVPLVTLSPTPSLAGAGESVFRLFFTPEGEARALVEGARERGRRRLAVLHPDNAYGQTMRDAFVAAVRAAGLEHAGAVAYAEGATSFGPQVTELAALAPDAVFVPDAGRRVALVAPALASVGLWSRPAGEAAPANGRAITLLLPSVGLDAQLPRTSGRYLQGALFSAPFHAPTATGTGRAFVDAYQARHGRAPDAFAAYARDAYELVRRAVASGASTRREVAQRLATFGEVETAGASGGLGRTREANRATRLLELAGTGFVPAGR